MNMDIVVVCPSWLASKLLTRHASIRPMTLTIAFDDNSRPDPLPELHLGLNRGLSAYDANLVSTLNFRQFKNIVFL